MRGRHRAGHRFTVVLLWTSIASSVQAGNGINPIGFGAESVSVAGADIATTRDSNALNINPAALAIMTGHQFDVDYNFLHATPISHADANGASHDSDMRYVRILTGGYVQHLNNIPMTIGIGVFAQAGAGADFTGMQTVFGTRDQVRNLIRVASLNTGLGYTVSDTLSVGMSLVMMYADAEQDVLPNTSVAAPFFGYQLRDVSDTALGFNLGLRYQIGKQNIVGVAYKSPVEFTLDGGYLVSNQTALGLGNVTYRSVTIEGIRQPQELGIGIQHTLQDNFNLAAELNWVNWSNAFTSSTLTASNPDTPGAPAVLSQTGASNWRDQIIIALGFSYEVSSALTWRAGANYGRNPIPNESLSPLLAPVTEYNIATGISYQHSQQSKFDAVLEYSIPNEQTYTNPNSPLGPNTSTTTAVIGVHLAYSMKW